MAPRIPHIAPLIDLKARLGDSRMTSLGLVLVSALMLVASVSSASLVYKASCNGTSTVPPVSSKATGTATVILYNASYASGYFYATNINQMTMAHLHASAVGKNGPAIVWAFNATYGPISGSVKASFTFNPSVNNVSALLAAGLVYFNIHTTANPAGELRGQLIGPGNISYPAPPPLLTSPPPPPPAASANLEFDFSGLTKEQALAKIENSMTGKTLYPCGISTSSESDPYGSASCSRASTANAPRATVVIASQFSSWADKYGKNYTDDDRGAAVKAFVDCVQTVYAANADPSIPFVVSCNPKRGGLTYKEFKRTTLMGKKYAPVDSSLPESGSRKLLGTSTPPASLDWRKSGMVPAVKDQGSCGSCWAFAATGAMETMYRISTGGANFPIDLSEQQLVDCANAKRGFPVSEGCDGGLSSEAIDYIAKNSQTTEAAYPDTSSNSGKTGICRFTPIPGQVVKPSQASVTALPGPRGISPEQALMSALTVGPVTVYFQVLDKFSLYASGVYDPASECKADSKEINHAMLLVGYDTTTNPPYWIIRNSWSNSWGEGGYARVKMVSSASWPYGPCGMYQWSYQVSPSFALKLGAAPPTPTQAAKPPPPPINRTPKFPPPPSSRMPPPPSSYKAPPPSKKPPSPDYQVDYDYDYQVDYDYDYITYKGSSPGVNDYDYSDSPPPSDYESIASARCGVPCYQVPGGEARDRSCVNICDCNGARSCGKNGYCTGSIGSCGN